MLVIVLDTFHMVCYVYTGMSLCYTAPGRSGHLNQLNNGYAEWSFLILSHDGASRSSVIGLPWYVAP